MINTCVFEIQHRLIIINCPLPELRDRCKLFGRVRVEPFMRQFQELSTHLLDTLFMLFAGFLVFAYHLYLVLDLFQLQAHPIAALPEFLKTELQTGCVATAAFHILIEELAQQLGRVDTLFADVVHLIRSQVDGRLCILPHAAASTRPYVINVSRA